ncbi:MAG TPA: glycoside hydrolase family 57 protein, partial [Gammaproteobacteria bacterium]|nr:glycoside hydrolase family 57 protein [Gammaproteobacteria bacterium]
DLIVWFHLAWVGETVRRRDERVQRLMDKAEGFSQHDRRQLLEVIGEVLAGVLERYAQLAEAGKVELAMSPYGHPIVPLMLDLASARESEPHAKMPMLERYPGGRERVDWHLQEGLRMFEEHLGVRPVGCWPSEGGISTATVQVLAEHGFRWAASGGSVLRNSLARNGLELECIHRPYRVNDCDVGCFFRDDGLSDLIGFEYSDWHAEDAVANLIHHLENIESACEGEANRVVPIILDGENAWEFYPENGYYFLTELYRRLAEHSGFELTTFNECLDAGLEPTVLEEGIVAGSWVYGTFSTWIGDRDKNRGWDLLGEAKRCFDEVVAEGRLTDDDRQAAERQLAICEGSDWFWWFGDYNPSESVRDFDRLYRLHLANLYRLLGEEPPDELSQVISHGGGHPARGGTMRPGQEPQ